jgi:hypothetical protein
MREHWPEVLDLFKIIAYILKSKDKDGLDLYFTSSIKKYHDKNSGPLYEVIMKKGNEPERGRSDMSGSLEQVLGDYMRATKDAIRQNKTHRSLNVYILTDGKWNPKCNIVPAIDKIVSFMDSHKLPEKTVGLQFIRFGADAEGGRKLQLVDNYLNLPL